MLVVRDCNKNSEYMDDTERKLFKTLTDAVDKEIHLGLSKLRWSSKGILETFVRLIRRVAGEIYGKLKMFKTNTDKIE